MTPAAKCTLGDFLDGPEAEPPADWVSAVTHRGHTTDDRAERALDVGGRADETERRIADLRSRRGASSRDDEAVGILMATFNVDAGRAFECLLWVSEQSGTALPVVARRFLDEVDAMGSGAHDREALLELLGALAESPGARAG